MKCFPLLLYAATVCAVFVCALSYGEKKLLSKAEIAELWNLVGKEIINGPHGAEEGEFLTKSECMC